MKYAEIKSQKSAENKGKGEERRMVGRVVRLLDGPHDFY